MKSLSALISIFCVPIKKKKNKKNKPSVADTVYEIIGLVSPHLDRPIKIAESVSLWLTNQNSSNTHCPIKK